MCHWNVSWHSRKVRALISTWHNKDEAAKPCEQCLNLKCEFCKSETDILFSPRISFFPLPPLFVIISQAVLHWLITCFLLDVGGQSEPFWPVLWKWWRPGCSPPPSLSTSLKSSSALWMEPAWPALPHLVLCTVSSKKFVNTYCTWLKKMSHINLALWDIFWHLKTLNKLLLLSFHYSLIVEEWEVKVKGESKIG